MQKTEKIKYEIDPHNRLIYAKTARESKVPYFRTVLDGEFKIGKNNQLIYHLKKSKIPNIPQQVKLRGRWSLDKDHNLALALNKWGNQIAGNKLTLDGKLLDSKANKLSFLLATKDSEGKTHIYILELEGSWQADQHNRLTFNIRKEKDTSDKIILQGAWEVDKKNQLIYTYSKSYLKTKIKISNTITFKGYWDITEKYRIIYVLDKEINSQFDFKVSLRKAVKGRIRYEVGIGVTPLKRTISLFGEWKLNQRLGLMFEMPYEQGKFRRIIFGASVKFDKNYNLDFKLRNELGQDLGIDVKLSKEILRSQGEAFIRALKSKEEASLVAGMGIRW